MIGRREFVLGAAASPLLRAAPGVKREVFLRSPGKGTAVMCYAFYTKASGGEMISIEQRYSRSDTIDIAYYRTSKDNGKTWSAAEASATGEKRANGMWRKHNRAGYVDPQGRYLEFWNEGILPSDDPLEGMKQWNLYYRTKPGGPMQQVIEEGKEYHARHALPGVYTGKNSVTLGDWPCTPLTLRNGALLAPVEISPLGTDGEYYNPTGGYTYTDAAVVVGKWEGDRISWRASERVKGDPARSTRGMVEPTLGQLEDGRVLMVMRGSNDKNHALPSYKWVSTSADGGAKWTEPKPWTYDSGQPFFSPSACSQLLKHSSGRLFWLGNINPANPKGNRPRYPFVIGEVDRRTGLLKKATVRGVDTRQEGESDLLTLSNFFAREDRETKEIALHMTRLFAFPDGWVGDAMLYRIGV